MQTVHVLALDRIELKALLLGATAGVATGTVLWILDCVDPWSVIQAAAYAGCGGLAVGIWHGGAGAAPAKDASPQTTMPAALSPLPDIPQSPDLPVGPPAEMVEAAATLGQLDPFFSVTEQQLRSVVSQTETAAGDIIAALQILDAAQARSAACVARTRDGMVGLAEDGDAALRTLADTLNAYLLERLETTRAEREAIGGLGEQMRSLDALTAGLEKVAASTRMLALNANIEATRAGSHGAGFQVIARELQSLAQNSQESVAEARRRVASVQTTIDGVVLAAHDAARTGAEEARIQKLMTELGGIAEMTTRTIAGMARTEFAEIEAQSGQVGDQVSVVFGQVQFQDVVRQQIEAVADSVQMLRAFLGDMQQSLDGLRPDRPLQPDLLLEAVRGRYVTQIQRRTDAEAVGGASQAAETSMIELF
ncbi:MAG TPA: methyl-accepting chemotaxis protein [Methylorubrum populi]|uniref:Methyl-accepting chemotaxis protein n=1 Tax=Methylorubrum populi TaxID=223967 RepID=A0A921E5Y2_9HYPH|nr:methyl-accepting chemotaxis protein [Methylorubrum populi]